MSGEYREALALLRSIRDELSGIRRALEAANANDPVAAMERALAEIEVSPQDTGGDVSFPHDPMHVLINDAPGIPPEERWRLQ